MSTKFAPSASTMLSDTTESLVVQITQLPTQFNQALFHAPVTLLVLMTALLLWRLWTFTIYPWLHPKEPKEVPYWIPCKLDS